MNVKNIKVQTVKGLSSGRELGINICRVCVALCVMADGAWFLATYETRTGYFKQLGLPTFLIYILSLVHLINGFRILINHEVEMSCLAMIVTYGAVLFVVHHPVGPGGIGDYPKGLHDEFNFMQILKYMGMIGTVFIVNGYVDFRRRGGVIMQGTKSYSIVLGRAAIGLHFVLENIWFRIIQYELRSKQILLMGGHPLFHVWIVGFLFIILGVVIWLGRPDLRRMAAASCGILTLLLAITSRSSLTMAVGIFHMKRQEALHQHVLNIGIAIGCALVYLLGDKPVAKYTKTD